MKSSLLKAKVVQSGRDDVMQALGDLLGISRTTVYYRLYSKRAFTESEMKLIKAEYNLTNDEFVEIFFGDEDDGTISAPKRHTRTIKK